MRTRQEIEYTIVDSVLGPLLVARSEHGLCAVLMGNDEAEMEQDLGRRFPDAVRRRDDEGVGELAAEVAVFVESPERGFDVPLDLRGTAFQREVWEALRGIPAGATASYSEIAKRIGRPGSVRAVGGACAANALAVVVPCHRVLRSDGGLSGFYWGMERKRDLLAREAGTRCG